MGLRNVASGYRVVFNFWVIVTVILDLHHSSAIDWKSYTDDNIFYLYFTSTINQSSSNAEADSQCAQNGYKLIEIENEVVQQVLDNAMISWADNIRPLPGFYFRLNLDVLISGWTWLDGTALASQYFMNSYPYFAFLNKNASGISYQKEFERKLYNFICSYKRPCEAGSNQFFDTASQSCFHVDTTQRLNWFSARSECLQLGGDLAVLSQQDTWTINLSVGTYWVGLAKARYVWTSTGKLVNYTHWGDGEPIEGHDCAYFSQPPSGSSAFWHKSPCNESHPFICMSGTVPSSTIPKISSTITTTTSSYLQITTTTSITTTSKITTTTTIITFQNPSITTTTTSQNRPSTTNTTSPIISTTVTTRSTETSTLPFPLTSTAKTSTSESLDPPSTGASTGVIVGFSLFGLVLIFLIVMLVICYFKRNGRNSRSDSSAIYKTDFPFVSKNISSTDSDGKGHADNGAVGKVPDCYEIIDKQDNDNPKSIDNKNPANINDDIDMYEGPKNNYEGLLVSEVDENLYEENHEYEAPADTEKNVTISKKHLISNSSGKASIYGGIYDNDNYITPSEQLNE